MHQQVIKYVFNPSYTNLLNLKLNSELFLPWVKKSQKWILSIRLESSIVSNTENYNVAQFHVLDAQIGTIVDLQIEDRKR